MRRFRKMPLFGVVDIPILFPCLPNPFPPKSMCILDPQVFLLLQTTLIRGVTGFVLFKRNEIVNELNF